MIHSKAVFHPHNGIQYSWNGYSPSHTSPLPLLPQTCVFLPFFPLPGRVFSCCLVSPSWVNGVLGVRFQATWLIWRRRRGWGGWWVTSPCCYLSPLGWDWSRRAAPVNESFVYASALLHTAAAETNNPASSIRVIKTIPSLLSVSTSLERAFFLFLPPILLPSRQQSALIVNMDSSRD